MTNNICKSTCAGKGFALAGTQNNQCFCDSVIRNGQSRTSSSLCTSPCPGNASSQCGGYYKFSIFNSTASSTTPSASSSGTVPSASASGTTSRGCFSDLNVLNNNAYSSGYMTIDQCLTYCKGQKYAFAGLANGNTCRCGNTPPVVNVGRASCTTACVSNSKQLCGGNNLVEVWPTTQTGYSDAFSSAAADSNGYMGCWQDSSARILNGTTFSTPTMTPASCQANCAVQGYKFSGTESSSQCFCGNQPRAGMQRYAEDRCTLACAGDKTAKCGGSWAINLWVARPGSTSSSSGSASSVSTSKSASSVSSVSSASRSASTSNAPSSVPTSAATEGYKGCYGLGTFVSAAPASYIGSAQMTIGFCRRFCRVQGYSAAGLQNGNSEFYPTAITDCRLLLWNTIDPRCQAGGLDLHKDLCQ